MLREACGSCSRPRASQRRSLVQRYDGNFRDKNYYLKKCPFLRPPFPKLFPSEEVTGMVCEYCNVTMLRCFLRMFWENVM